LFGCKHTCKMDYGILKGKVSMSRNASHSYFQ
jgi:hypothetical protein